jgi:pimeloyl-ACP methyl ester carboxylesterase
MKKIGFLMICVLASLFVSAQVEGSWKGELQFNGQSLPLQVHIELRKDSTWSATFDSPSQGAFDIPFSSTVFINNKLLCKLNAMSVKMELLLVESGKLEGTWQQGGASLPLVMERTERVIGKKRPQEPQGALSYKEIQVEIPNPKAKGVVLSGTLTIPQGKGPFTAVVLLNGSGPQDRNSEVFGHKPFLVLSDFLTRNGIAVLRYDDRGVGQSKGDFASATTYDLASDGEAALAFLKQQKNIRSEHTGLIGHSEGSMLASIIANTDTKPAFVLSIAGPGIPIHQLLLQQLKDITRVELNNESDLDSVLFFSQKSIEYAYMSSSVAAMMQGIDSFVLAMRKLYPQLVPDETDKLLAQQLNAWFWYFLQFNPQHYWYKIQVPVLVVNGLKDLQVEGTTNAAAIMEQLGQNNPHNKMILYPDLNHLMQKATTGAISEYGQIEETFHQQAMEDMLNWIKRLPNKGGKKK